MSARSRSLFRAMRIHLFAATLRSPLSLPIHTAIAAVLATPPSVRAQEGMETEAEVFVVLAFEREGQLDPSLESIAALHRAPFNAFHTMEVLSRTSLELRPGVPTDVDLPNGRIVRLELESMTDEGRYRVRVSINRPGQTDYLPLLQVVASPGDPFFVAGQNYRGGTMVIGVRVGRRSESL